ncbi:Na/Pi cotransporter family protein [Alkalithermobacter paradoxus]|uniref:Transcriptional regulator PhoU n=1 Tax=Alkalithermobacter paradoxus TaxID=29349 RepID=A0A1V4I8L6_9FIRM|nr:transcriptional regulator PhoU [[Clostridium] thermoalcaliphilum]
MALEIGLGILGGLGLFLYGMNLMADGLQKAAGSKLKKIIELLTKNTLTGVLVGAFVTAIVQSSSATTVMVVGFVNAGIMNLTQAVGLIMGANVGTTITAQLVAFKLEDIAPIVVGVGMMLYLFSNKPKTKQIAEVLIGFGILFIGMGYLSKAVRPLRDVQAFKDLLVSFAHNPMLGILMGFALTVMVQSSTASMGILLALASQGLIPLASALPILYGQNIGTCVTALISSIGASKNAKRAAMLHLIFNIVGTVLFATILVIPIRTLVVSLSPNDVVRQIANTHTLFNVINVIIQFPFAALLVKTVMILIPEREDEKEANKTTKYLDDRILQTPSIALENGIRECLRMGKLAKGSFESAMDGFFSKSEEKAKETFEKERKVNELEKSIVDYMIKLSNTAMSHRNREIVNGLFHTVNDIERVGDHADNIAELAMVAIEKDLPFSNEAIDDLRKMYTKVLDTYKYSLECMKTGNMDLAFNVIKMEEQVDIMEKTCRTNHIHRLNTSSCNAESGIIFLDLISNMERIADHASNIARAVIDASKHE